MEKKPQCKYFLQGDCRYGATCKFSHSGNPNQNMNQFHQKKSYQNNMMGQQQYTQQYQQQDPNSMDYADNGAPPMNYPMGGQGHQGNQGRGQQGQYQGGQNQGQGGKNTNNNICRFFLKGTCNNNPCNFFHGYGTNLQYVVTEQPFIKQCIDVASITEGKIITAEEKSFKIFVMEPSFNCISEQVLQEGKITRLIYSNSKIILGIQIDQMLTTKTKVVVYTDTNNFGMDCNDGMTCINDIMEVDSFIICCGMKMIEVFFIDQQLKQLQKKALIQAQDEIMSIVLLKSFFLAGEKGGVISCWKPEPSVFLQSVGTLKVHDGSINKIRVKNVNENTNYVMTCSSDMSIKIFNFENNMEMNFHKQFNKIVYDIYNIMDFDGRDCFILSLGGGLILCVNNNFETLFEIESKINADKRIAIPLLNPCKTATIGNILAFTDGPGLEINAWIKEGSFVPSSGNKKHGSSNHYQGNSHRGGRGGHYHPRGGY